VDNRGEEWSYPPAGEIYYWDMESLVVALRNHKENSPWREFDTCYNLMEFFLKVSDEVPNKVSHFWLEGEFWLEYDTKDVYICRRKHKAYIQCDILRARQ
jgi:hypothetical protein